MHHTIRRRKKICPVLQPHRQRIIRRNRRRGPPGSHLQRAEQAPRGIALRFDFEKSARFRQQHELKRLRNRIPVRIIIRQQVNLADHLQPRRGVGLNIKIVGQQLAADHHAHRAHRRIAHARRIHRRIGQRIIAGRINLYRTVGLQHHRLERGSFRIHNRRARINERLTRLGCHQRTAVQRNQRSGLRRRKPQQQSGSDHYKTMLHHLFPANTTHTGKTNRYIIKKQDKTYTKHCHQPEKARTETGSFAGARFVV